MPSLIVLHTLLVAQLDAAAATGGPMAIISSALPIALMFAVVYFLLLRPANKQKVAQQQLLSSLKKDDEVVTTAGILGRIVALEERIITLEIADRVKIKILRERVEALWQPTAQSTETRKSTAPTAS